MSHVKDILELNPNNPEIIIITPEKTEKMYGYKDIYYYELRPMYAREKSYAEQHDWKSCNEIELRKLLGMNQAFGLPHAADGKMQKVLVAFDVDGTLIGEGGRIHGNMLQLLVSFLTQGWKNVDVIVWSGGGADYARNQIERTSDYFRGRQIWHSKLEYEQLRQNYDMVIAFDDIQDTRLGDVNLIVRNK